MRASGLSGELRYGYQCAARLGAWTIESCDGGFRFAAPIAEAHEVWIVCRPLRLVLALGRAEWVWDDVDPAIDGATVTITLTHRPSAAGARVE